MTQEEKKLLLVDLCGRLPYGVKCHIDTGDADVYVDTLATITIDGCACFLETIDTEDVLEYGNIKPLLFPMSSMTDVIKDEIYQETGLYDIFEDKQIHIEVGTNFADVCKLFNILNKYHLDYNGLIPMNLAIDATGLNVY